MILAITTYLWDLLSKENWENTSQDMKTIMALVWLASLIVAFLEDLYLIRLLIHLSH